MKQGMAIDGVLAHAFCTKTRLGGHRAIARLEPLAQVLAPGRTRASVPPARGSGGLKLHVNAAADRCGDVDERIQ